MDRNEPRAVVRGFVVLTTVNLSRFTIKEEGRMPRRTRAELEAENMLLYNELESIRDRVDDLIDEEPEDEEDDGDDADADDIDDEE